MRRGRIPELGLLLLGYQLLQNIGLTNIPPVTLASIIIQAELVTEIIRMVWNRNVDQAKNLL